MRLLPFNRPVIALAAVRLLSFVKERLGEVMFSLSSSLYPSGSCSSSASEGGRGLG